MAKFRPGIPDDFDITIAPVQDLGDYLDEPSPMPVRKPKPQTIKVGEGTTDAITSLPYAGSAPIESVSRPAIPVQTIPTDRQVETRAPAPQAALPSTIKLTAEVKSAPIMLREERVIPSAITIPVQAKESIGNEDWLRKSKAPRREISMTPEAFRMSEELLEVIRSGSGQRDTAAKELVHALILLAHEVIDEIDPHSIPKRGRWGTPTARAYPLELKNAFLKAIIKKHEGSVS